nr:hypothetical protein [Tanacetum cinerariifolium]
MLSAAKVPLFFWAEAIATACFTQNRSLVIPRHEKTPYHIINDRKPVFNKRTRVIVETVHVNFDELPHMASDHVVSKSSAVITTDAPNQRQQQHTTPLNNQTTSDPTCQVSPHAPTVTSTENMNQAKMIAENAQVKNEEFINIFCTPLESDGEMYMFALTVSRTEPKNIKEAMANSALIESMQEELYQFDRLDVWELVDRPLCKNVINIKWLWKNKRDEENTIIRNKSHLVAKGCAKGRS